MKVSKILTLGLGGAAAMVVITFLVWPSSSEKNIQGNIFQVEKPTLHYYDDPQVPLPEIELDLVYFVPKDVKDNMAYDWAKVLGNSGKELKKFYEFQFEDSTKIDVKVYPKPVIANHETSYYNKADTNGGNPGALLRIRGELQKRLYEKAGDLYNTAFLGPEKKYAVLGIVYEGVGAAGSGEKRMFLVAREYLTRNGIADRYGPTFFNHEFGHALGMPDLVQDDTGGEQDKSVIFTNDDIMGSGRYRPLSRTYLSDEIKKHMMSSYEKN